MNRVDVLRGLKQLRTELEYEQGGLSEEQTTLLADTCHYIGLNDAETYYVVGDAFRIMIDVRQPITLGLDPALASVAGAPKEKAPAPFSGTGASPGGEPTKASPTAGDYS